MKENFIYLKYNLGEEIFPDLKPQQVMRLMFLATYANSRGELAVNRQRLMCKKDVEKILNLASPQFYDFYNELCDKGYLSVSEDGIAIVVNLNLETKDFDCLAKFKVETIRSLYETNSISSHKQLGYFFKLIQYVNINYNIFCETQLETYFQRLKSFYKKRDLGLFLDYNVSHLNRLFLELSKFKVSEQPIVKEVYSTQLRKKIVCLNPDFCYAGEYYDDAKEMGEF